MKRLALLVLLAAMGLAVAGCAGSGAKRSATESKSPKPHSQEGAGSSLVVPVGRQVWRRVKLAGVGARFISPTRLAFLTSGSGSCPSVPYQLIVRSSDSIRVNLTMGSWRRTGHSGRMKLVAQPPKNGACTTDLLISPVAIAIDPTRINIHHTLKVSLYYPLAKHPVVFTAPAL